MNSISESSSGGLVVLGSVNLDLSLRLQRLPGPGETVLGHHFSRALGGKGANQAVAAARLARRPVFFLAAVGDDAFGSEAVCALQREPQLHTDFLWKAADRETGLAMILVDEQGENLIGVHSGANVSLPCDHVRNSIVALQGSANILLASCELDPAVMVAGLQAAKELGWTTVLNPAPIPPPEIQAALLPWVDIWTPNVPEANLLTGSPIPEEGEQLPATIAGAGRRIPRLVVTRGRHGCVVIDGGVVTSIPAPSVTVVDTTGAGDAFNGALAVGLSESLSLRQAASWAVQAAALSVRSSGAQAGLPTRRELTDWLGQGPVPP